MIPDVQKEVIKLFIRSTFTELSRIATICLVLSTPYLIKVLEDYINKGIWSFDYKVLAAIVALGILTKGVDRGLHDSGIAEKGITRF